MKNDLIYEPTMKNEGACPLISCSLEAVIDYLLHCNVKNIECLPHHAMRQT